MDPLDEFSMYETYRNKNNDNAKYKNDKPVNNELESFGSFITSISKSLLGQKSQTNDTKIYIDHASGASKNACVQEIEYVSTDEDEINKKNVNRLYTQHSMSNLNDTKKKGVKLTKKGAIVTKLVKSTDTDTEEDDTFFPTVTNLQKQSSISGNPSGLISSAIVRQNAENIENKNPSVGQLPTIIKVKQEQDIYMSDTGITVTEHKQSDETETKASILLSEEDEDMFSYEDLLANLKLLSQVKKDFKLSISPSGNLIIDTRYFFPSVQRRFSGDGREKTCDVLKKIIKSSDYHSEYLISNLKDPADSDVRHKLQILTEDIIAARSGFRNLIITYRDDDVFLAKLDIYIDAFSVRKNKNVNFTGSRK